MLFITYFTQGTDYISFLKPLELSIKKFGFNLYAQEVKREKFWEYNCSLKASFCLENLLREKKPIIWIDVDAILVNFPNDLQENESDLSFCRVKINPPLYKLGKYPWGDYLDSEMWQYRTGVIKIDYNENTINFLKKWVEIQNIRKSNWDQVTFQKTCSFFKNLKYNYIPETYTVVRPYEPGKMLDGQVIYFREDLIHPKSKLRIYHDELKNIKFL